MRRISLICLLLATLLLVGCGARFDVTQTGYLDTKTDRHYTALSAAFEAAARGEEVGVFEDEKNGRVVTFYVIPNADASRFLTDEDGALYCADAVEPDASLWAISRILVCEEDAISVAIADIEDAAVISEITRVWFESQKDELPLESATTVRRLKMECKDFPGIYYCINYYVYEDGSAYFYDMITRRATLVPAALGEQIPLE